MKVSLRFPVRTDAVGAGMAQYQIWQETLGSEVFASFWDENTETACVERWHDQIAKKELGVRLVVACDARRVVGAAWVRPGSSDDRGLGPAARGNDIYFLGVLRSHYGQGIDQRLLDFILAPGEPAQIWVPRQDMALRRFLRINGFTMDGLTLLDESTGGEISRMVR